MKPKFKEGDRVVALADHSVVSIKKGTAYEVIKATSISVLIRTSHVYIYNECFEHEHIYNSPLYKALL